MIDNLDNLINNTARTNGTETEKGSFDTQNWKEKAKKDRDNAFSLLDDATLEFTSSQAKYQKFLDVKAEFLTYSIGNAFLITKQKPDAKKLMTFGEWKENGVFIKKNVAPVLVIVPGTEYIREDGSIGIWYNARKMYDASQVIDRNRSQKTYKQVFENKPAVLKALLASAPTNVVSTGDMLPDGVNGYYDVTENKIYIKKGLTDINVIISTLISESATCMLSQEKILDEGLAESIAYIVCKKINLPTDIKPYIDITVNNPEKTPSIIRTMLSPIQTISEDMCYKMKRIYEKVIEEKNQNEKSQDNVR